MLRSLPLSLLLAVVTATAAAAPCNRSCGTRTSPYPFGFSDGCPIRLSCAASNSTFLFPASGSGAAGYAVRNITAKTFLVAVPPSCDRPAAGVLSDFFTTTVTMSWRNLLLLRHCSKNAAANGSVDVPTPLIDAITRISSGAARNCTGDNSTSTCIANLTAGIDGFFHQRGALSDCKGVLTSAVYDPSTDDSSPSLKFDTAELQWWMEGDECRCHTDAICSLVPTAAPATAKKVNGYRCQCPPGLNGDGYSDGDGCHPAPAGCESGSCGARVNVVLLVGGIIAGTILALGLVCLCNMMRQRRVSTAYHRAAKRLISQASSNNVTLYSFRDISRATNSFSHTHHLGTGAYGTVYVGKLPSSNTLVAIKRLKVHGDNAEDNDILMNEVKLIASICHPNIARLLGCCLDQGERILVYEFVPNGTLAQHLHRDAPNKQGLPWRVRLVIAVETAHAIEYLHTEVQPPIYHRDVKSSNILLDSNFHPRLADFGLSRAGQPADDQRSHLSTAPQGTPGYVDPEYHQHFHLSNKSDVYSFGVVLLEMITAMRAVDFNRPSDEINLASLATDRIGKGRVDEIVDPILVAEGEHVMESVRKVAELAFRCLAFHKDMRPGIEEVAQELESIKASLSREEKSISPKVDLSYGGSDSKNPDKKLLAAKKEKTVVSPVSVQDIWIGMHSSPSTNESLTPHTTT